MRRMTMTEKWCDVAGYEGLYQVSDFGRVRSLDRTTIRSDGKICHYRGKLLKISPCVAGEYSGVTFSVDGVCRTMLIHRLMLLSFVGPPAEGEECRHLDGNGRNNCLENLKWGTSKENAADSIRHGTFVRGEKVWCSRLRELDVHAIRFWAKAGYMLKDIAAVFDVHPTHVTMIVKRQRWGWL